IVEKGRGTHHQTVLFPMNYEEEGKSKWLDSMVRKPRWCDLITWLWTTVQIWLEGTVAERIQHTALLSYTFS
ncbi:MAG: hypothetical protein JWM16_262, partial [Verrucomicrobiales bacterium]|nr:hypothetical protein [Verrucomicrobiales bacterium]